MLNVVVRDAYDQYDPEALSSLLLLLVLLPEVLVDHMRMTLDLARQLHYEVHLH